MGKSKIGQTWKGDSRMTIIDWEYIEESLYRLRIPNEGWLVTGNNNNAVCFVPDKKGEWKLE